MAKKKKVQYHGISRELRHLRIDEIPSPLFAVPQEAAAIRINCTSSECTAQYAPPWFERLPEELVEVITDEGILRVPAIVDLRCPRCNAPSTFNLPIVESRGQILFFGDESEQVFDQNGQNGRIFVYALIAFAPALLPHATEAMQQAKRKLRPTVDPKSWQFHTQSVRQSEWRKKKGVTLPHWEVDNVITCLADFLGHNENQHFISVTCLPPCRTMFSTEQLFERVLMIALLSTTQMATGMEHSPRFFLEAREDAHTKNMIDYAVERIGRGFRHSLTFFYVSRGITIGIPVTVPPSGTELEFADLVAFIARRELFRALIAGKSVEFPTHKLGVTNWTIIRQDGSFFSMRSKGMPPLVEVAPHNTSE